MPTIQPPGGPVDWPSGEGALGVVGVAPWATVDFLQVLYSHISAQKDWHYPRIVVDLNTKIPSRGRHFELGEADPSPAIAQTIEELAAAGATAAVVVCNTAHLLFDSWGRGRSIPVISIIDATAAAVAADGASQRVAVLSSRLLAHDGAYGRALADRGLDHFPLSESQNQLVAETIESVKQTGDVDVVLRESLEELAGHLRSGGVDAVVLGCTELSRTADIFRGHDLRVVDSNESLARVALDALKAGDSRWR